MTLWERVAAKKIKNEETVVEIFSEELLPEEYKKPDFLKIHIALQKGVKDIPGVIIKKKIKT